MLLRLVFDHLSLYTGDRKAKRGAKEEAIQFQRKNTIHLYLLKWNRAASHHHLQQSLISMANEMSLKSCKRQYLYTWKRLMDRRIRYQNMDSDRNVRFKKNTLLNWLAKAKEMRRLRNTHGFDDCQFRLISTYRFCFLPSKSIHPEKGLYILEGKGYFDGSNITI